jgi:hypothetical protein
MLRPGGSGNELASLPPEERVVAVAPTPDEGPAGYQYLGETEPSGVDELCVGVEKPAVTYPGVASHGVDFQTRGADGFVDPLFVDVAVHESADAAHQFILAIDGIESACNGRSPADPTGPGQMMRFEDVRVNAPRAEEIAATSWVLIDPAFTIPDLYHIAARVDDLVVSVTGGDLALAEYYTQLVVARAQGEPDPPRVEPSG